MAKLNVLQIAGVAIVLASISPDARASAETLNSDEISGDAFSTITLEGSVLFEAGGEEFQDFWDPGFGGEFAVTTPVPYGFFEIAAHPFANDPLQANLPRIRSMGTYLGWGLDVHLPRNLLFRASARTGVFWMLYDATAEHAAQDENELAFGGRASFHYSLSPAWGVQAGVRAARVLTRKEIDFLFAGGGIAWTFSSPDWLRGFLE